MGALLDSYFPEGRPQERVLTVLALYAELGPGLIEMLDKHPNLFEFNHFGVIV
jgi:hypothetical protein